MEPHSSEQTAQNSSGFLTAFAKVDAALVSAWVKPDHAASIDHSWEVADDGQQQADEELHSTAELEPDAKWREQVGANQSTTLADREAHGCDKSYWKALDTR